MRHYSLFDGVLDVGLRDSVEDGKKNLGILSSEEIPEEIKELIAKREAARIAHNWPEADLAREALNLKGYSIEDTRMGQK